MISVPEYEVVSIRSLNKRSIEGERLVSFNAFGKDLRLQLQKNPHLVKESLPMFIAEQDPSTGVHYKEIRQVCFSITPFFRTGFFNSTLKFIA